MVLKLKLDKNQNGLTKISIIQTSPLVWALLFTY